MYLEKSVPNQSENRQKKVEKRVLENNEFSA